MHFTSNTTRKQPFCVGQKRTQKLKSGRLCVGLSFVPDPTKKLGSKRKVAWARKVDASCVGQVHAKRTQHAKSRWTHMRRLMRGPNRRII